MRRFLICVCLASMPLAAQLTYTVSKTTTLSTSAEVVTVQQAATGAFRVVRFVSAFIDSTVSCGVVIEVNGTAASSTALTPAAVDPSGNQVAALSTGWSSSNVGTGTVITRATVPASGGLVVDLSRISMSGTGTNKNLTVRTASCTGVVDIVITYTESNS